MTTTNTSGYGYNEYELHDAHGYASQGYVPQGYASQWSPAHNMSASFNRGGQLGNPLNRLSPTRIRELLVQPQGSFRREVADRFTAPLLNESIESQEATVIALNNFLTQCRNIKQGFAQAVESQFAGYLASSGKSQDSQQLWLIQLQSAFNGAKAAKAVTKTAAKAKSSQPAIWVSIISAATTLRKWLQKTCITLTTAATNGVKTVMQVMRRLGMLILSIAKNLSSWLRDVFAKFKTSKTDVLSLITNQNVREKMTPFKQKVLSHFKSKLDTINLLSQGSQKASLIQALAEFLAQDNDTEFLGEYTSTSHVSRFNSSQGYYLLNPMAREDVMRINKVLTEAFDVAKAQFTIR